MTRKKTTTRRKSSSRSSNRRARSRRPKLRLSLDVQQKAIILGILLIFVTAIVALSLLSPNQGDLTTFLAEWMWKIFGWGGVIVPIALAIGGFYMVLWGMDQPPNLPFLRLMGIAVMFLAFEASASLAWVAWDNNLVDVKAVAEAGEGGGYLGGFVAWVFTTAVGQLGTVFILLVIGIIGAILASGVSREELGLFLRNLYARRKSATPEREVVVNNGRASARVAGKPLRQVQEPVVRQPPLPVVEPEAERASPKPEKKSSGRRWRRKRKGTAAPQAQTASGQFVAPTPVFLGQDTGQRWVLPELANMLEPGDEQDVGDATIRDQVEVIEHTLASFGAPATVVEINQGPTITQYGVEPSFIEQRSGKRTKVKVGKIAGLVDDLALALAAQSIRIQAPVPGKGYVGIEVPNREKALVSLRDVMEANEFRRIKASLPIGLGQNVAGQPIATDLTQMPHLLIAGATGTGKSICINSIIACLLLQNTPDTLRLVMVDPKRVELTGYNGIPHLVAPVVVDLDRVVGTLQWAMREMDKRYKQLADMGARNIAEFNRKAARKKEEKMTYIVIVIDELADLMMLSPEDTERGITRLAQLARATGIHMIIATQRPSVDVVTGLIKANFPARIAFAVASSTDSRVILDSTGAERLLGQGDMLFQSPDSASPLRLQGCFVSETELNKIIQYWQGARRFGQAATRTPVGIGSSTSAATEIGSRVTETKSVEPGTDTSLPGLSSAEEIAAEIPAAALEEPTEPLSPQQPLWNEMREVEEEAIKYSDEMLPEAIAKVRQLGKASTSLLQRHFRIGYTRAARMMDVMKEDGIIGPPTGTSKARKVLPWDEGGGSEPEGLEQDKRQSEA